MKTLRRLVLGVLVVGLLFPLVWGIMYVGFAAHRELTSVRSFHNEPVLSEKAERGLLWYRYRRSFLSVTSGVGFEIVNPTNRKVVNTLGECYEAIKNYAPELGWRCELYEKQNRPD